MTKFGTSIIDSKVPRNRGGQRITGLEPSPSSLLDKVTGGKPLAEALAFENPKLNFSHVEPTGFFWRVDHLKSLGGGSVARVQQARDGLGSGSGAQ